MSNRQRRFPKKHDRGGRSLRFETLEPRVVLSNVIGMIPKEPPDYKSGGSLVGGRSGDAPLILADTFRLQSRPGSNFTIFLDFDGHITEGTSWNSYYSIETIISPPYNLDSDPNAFSDAELQRIQDVWKHVTEDFAPFDVNVTTIDPGSAALTNSGNGDSQWGIRVVITDDTFANCSCGGHAFINSFNRSVDEPTFVYNKGLDGVSEAVSHEVGHTMNLSHDGTSAVTYYLGHGTGTTSWGPIMGAGYYVQVTQWDDGVYYDANNGGSTANYGHGPEDLEVLTTTNGFGYATDDHGDTLAAATELAVADATQVSAFGVIQATDDVDYFSFQTGAGDVSFDILPLDDRPNLDIWAGIYDSLGTLIEESNPGDVLSASFANVTLDAGTYYVKVDGVGNHGVYDPVTDTVEDPPDPAPWQIDPPEGYSQYGSLGQYAILGTVIAPGTNTFSLVPDDAVKREGDGGLTSFTFTVTREGDIGLAATVDYTVDLAMPELPGENYPWTVDGDDFSGGFLPSGSIEFLENEWLSTVTIDVVGDTIFEEDEHFVVVLSHPSDGWVLANSVAPGTIQSDENQVAFAPASPFLTYRAEGDPVARALLRWRQISYSSGAYDEWGIDNVFLEESTFADDFDPELDAALWSDIRGGTANDNFGGTGNSLFMSGTDDRWATSILVEPHPGDLVSFDLIFGDGSNGGENADAGEDVVLEFSLDGGATWESIGLYDTEDYTSWTTIHASIPADVAGTSLVYFVSRKGDLDVTTTVDWQVETAGYPAPADSEDFVGGVLPSGQLVFTPGEESKVILLAVASDYDVEPDEEFSVRLLNAVSGVPVSVYAPFESARGTILNDDVVRFDFGDAPDPPYATSLASDGAQHQVSSLYLGMTIDSESDGQSSEGAAGDGDDEDGVAITSDVALGTQAGVDVVATKAGLLNAWIDFNDDGDWLDPGEQIFQDLALAAGTNSLLFAVPADGVVTSQTIARFRLSTQAGLSFTGLAPDGEVEDYAVAISNPAPTDLTVTPSSINENTDTSGGDVEIGTLTPTDVATGDTYTYSLVAGDGDTDNGSFVIVGDKLLVQQGTELDFETQAAYSVRVNVNDGFSDFAKALTVSIDDLPEVEQVSVGDGSEARSMVTQVVVTFDQILVLDAGVFSVQQRGATGGPVDVSYTTSDVGGKTVATLTFSGAFVESSGSLADGNYDLTIDATKARTATDVPLDGDRDGTAGGDYQLGTAAADAFFRLFGDRDGSRSVGLIDYAYLLNTFGKRTGEDGFDPQFDHDISGSVGFLDYAFFLEQYRKRMIFE